MLDKSSGRAIRARTQAERHVSRVVRDLRRIGKLARYDFTEPEIAQMLTAIHAEIERLEISFAPQPQTSAEPEFKFQ